MDRSMLKNEFRSWKRILHIVVLSGGFALKKDKVTKQSTAAAVAISIIIVVSCSVIGIIGTLSLARSVQDLKKSTAAIKADTYKLNEQVESLLKWQISLSEDIEGAKEDVYELKESQNKEVYDEGINQKN